MNTSERLKYVREKVPSEDINQEEFAKIIGVHRNTVGRYERGETLPDLETCAKICTIFGVSPEWLLLGVGEILSPPNQELGGKRAQKRETSCPGCLALERILQQERQERQTLNKENSHLREQIGRLEERLKAESGGGNGSSAIQARSA